MLAICFVSALFLASCNGDKDSRIEVNPQDLYGLWYSESSITHGFWRYNSDGTGTAWDPDDDVHEGEENTKFTWEIEVDQITHIFKGEQGNQNDPKIYTITAISSSSMTWDDGYGNIKYFDRR